MLSEEINLSGGRWLPPCNSAGKHHIDRPLFVPDKAVVKHLIAKLTPLIKALGDSKKLFLSILAQNGWLHVVKTTTTWPTVRSRAPCPSLQCHH